MRPPVLIRAALTPKAATTTAKRADITATGARQGRARAANQLRLLTGAYLETVRRRVLLAQHRSMRAIPATEYIWIAIGMELDVNRVAFARLVAFAIVLQGCSAETSIAEKAGDETFSEDESVDEDVAFEMAADELSEETFEDVGDTSLCTQDCSGHDAGFEWARDNEITDPSECGGKSQSFEEGCEAYAESLQEQAEEYASEGGY